MLLIGESEWRKCLQSIFNEESYRSVMERLQKLDNSKERVVQFHLRQGEIVCTIRPPIKALHSSNSVQSRVRLKLSS